MSHDESSKGCCGSCQGDGGKCGGAKKGYEISGLRPRQETVQDRTIQPAVTLSEVVEVPPQQIESYVDLTM